MQLDTARFSSRFPCKYPEPNFPTNGVLIGNSVGKKRPCWRMIADGYAGRHDLGFKVSSRSSGGSSSRGSVNNGRIYRRQDSCLAIPPSNGKKPRGIVKFLGGAFIGAVPEVTYGYFIELLAKEGYLVISVPYNVTFDHTKAANEIYEKFHSCLNGVLTNGLPEDGLSAGDLVDLPLFSVGHRSAAAMLVGSYFAEKIPKANAVISYNNRPSSEAVPYFEQFGALVKQAASLIEASPVYSLARSALGGAFKDLFDITGAVIAEYDKEALVSLNKLLKGFQSSGHHCQKTATFSGRHTTCNAPYWFSVDPIDETDLLEETLRPRVEPIGGTLEKIQLIGNCITPCAQEPKWQAGYLYTPADAIAQEIKTLSLNETRVLARTVSDWLRPHEK